jgi:hypothetical protein
LIWNNSGSNVLTTAALVFGKWNEVVLFGNSTSSGIYLNGILNSTVNVAGTSSSGNLIVWNYSGLYGDFKVWNRTLSSAEISSLFNNGCPICVGGEESNWTSWSPSYFGGNALVTGINGSLSQYKAVFTSTNTNYSAFLQNVSVSYSNQNSSLSLIVSGWNLISFPVLPSNRSVSNVLSPIAGNYTKIQTYNSSLGEWLTYDVTAPSTFESLSNLTLGTGYWLLATQNSSLLVSGTQSSSTTIPIVAGWNLISFPYASESVNAALSSISGNYTKVQIYNSSLSQWQTYVPGLNSTFDTLTLLSPGSAYWLEATSNSTLTMN